MKNSLLLPSIFVCLLSTINASSDDLSLFSELKAGIAFYYPRAITLYREWERAILKEKGCYIIVQIVELPLDVDNAYGWSNSNIKEVKEGLQRNEIRGYPFRNPRFARVIDFGDKKAIETYTLSDFSIDNIHFDHYLLLFNRQYVILITVSADGYKDRIIAKYSGLLFEPLINLGNVMGWKPHREEHWAEKQMLSEIKNNAMPEFKVWNDIYNSIFSSLQLN